MFRSVLIANRGEIACRIIATCRNMGLRTVAVYSDADRDALHVRLADEAVHIGPPQPSESYLSIETILRAAETSDAEAVHPGYGFLSENAAFAAALQEAGVAFVGPGAEAIRQMGDKIESKRIAEQAGVPGVPGYNGDDQADAALIAQAGKIGFPLMVKASAGGGGKGMRRVYERAGLEEAIDMARKEAKASFGDDRLLIEKLITRPRHLEVQIAADRHGNVIHLFERDCSVQRNNQKVLEEAPAPNLSDAVREKLFSRAIALASAIGYDSLGTVEFIMDADEDTDAGEPAFLEMNTRLQVEHPVTEYITGLDLVALQIRIAAGEELPFGQGDVAMRGHAIEARVTAEKPAENFMPAIGHIRAIHWPAGIRLDTGIEAGNDISQYYDSMIAKLIACGTDRREACDRLATALESTAIIGVETNIAFLRDCVVAPDFREGRATTRFLSETFPDGWQPDETGETVMAVRAAAIRQALAEAHQPFTGFRLAAPARSFLMLEIADSEPREMIVIRTEDDLNGTRYAVSCGDETHEVGVRIEGTRALVFGEGYRTGLTFHMENETLWLGAKGRVRCYRILPSADFARTRPAGGDSGDVVSDMPGAVIELLVGQGDRVAAGAPVLVIESMKLLVTLRAPISGTVSMIGVAPGDSVKSGTVLVSIDPDDDAA